VREGGEGVQEGGESVQGDAMNTQTTQHDAGTTQGQPTAVATSRPTQEQPQQPQQADDHASGPTTRRMGYQSCQRAKDNRSRLTAVRAG